MATQTTRPWPTTNWVGDRHADVLHSTDLEPKLHSSRPATPPMSTTPESMWCPHAQHALPQGMCLLDTSWRPQNAPIPNANVFRSSFVDFDVKSLRKSHACVAPCGAARNEFGAPGTGRRVTMDSPWSGQVTWPGRPPEYTSNPFRFGSRTPRQPCNPRDLRRICYVTTPGRTRCENLLKMQNEDLRHESHLRHEHA